MKKRFFAVFSLILAAVFLVACSSQSTGEKNWEKIEKRGSIKGCDCWNSLPTKLPR